MNRKGWTIAGVLVSAMAISGIAMASDEESATVGTVGDGAATVTAGLPANIAHALTLERHRRHHHRTLGGVRR